MKKFLSVLLALAVAFTFTFGSTMSAFADDEHTVTAAELNAGYAAAQNALTAKDASLYTAETGSFTTYADVEGLYKQDASGNYVLADPVNDANPAGTTYYSKVSYAVDLSVWKDALKKAYDDKMDAVVAGTYKTEATLTDYVVLEVRDDLLGLTYDGTSKYAGYAAATQFDSEIAKIAAKMEACDTSIYSSKTYTAAEIGKAPLNTFLWDVDGTTYYVAQEVAKAQVAKNVKSFKETYLEKYKTVVEGTLGATLNDVMGQYKAALSVLNEDGDYVLATTPKAILTTAKENSLDASNNAAIANGITVLENDIAAYLNDEKTEKYSSFTSKTATTKADVDEAIAAYRTGKTWLNNNGSIYTATDINYATMSPFVTAVANVTKWNAKAEELKAKKNDDGSPMYDADAVDEALFNATVAEYGASHNGSFNPAAITYLTTVEKADYKSVVTVDDKTSEDITSIVIAGTIDSANENAIKYFYNLEWATVKAAIDTYNSAVDAATTKAEVKKAQAALKTAVNKVKDQTAVEALYKEAGTINATFKTERTALVNYYKYFVTLNPTATYVPVFTDVTTAKTGNEAVNAIASTDLAYWYITKGARTVADVKALAEEAKAAVGAAKTTTELKAEAQKVVDMIAALPTAVTLDNKADVAAAVEAYNDLDSAYKAYVSNIGTLVKAVKALQVAEYTAVDTAVKALPSVGKVAISDKKAVNDAYDAAKAYNETEMYDQAAGMTNTKAFDTSSIITLAKKVQEYELDAIKDAVDNLPKAGKVTADDQKAIEELRTAYDAYIDEYVTNYDSTKHTAYNASTLAGYENKLVAAETELAAVIAEEAWTATDVKASLFDSSRKLTIWRTSKTSIRVTSTGSVADIKDHGYTVEYKFYKKAPGATSYKLVKTTSSNKYTYTNLKKGTNKFQVKVVVKDADGKVVASKWTYYRAAKIK